MIRVKGSSWIPFFKGMTTEKRLSTLSDKPTAADGLSLKADS